jgi:alpha-ketoglutarate-dependent taurine dioxygenase
MLTDVYALVPCYASTELRRDLATLETLSGILNSIRVAMMERNIHLTIVEPNADALDRINTQEGLVLMDAYVALADCIIDVEGLRRRYPSSLSTYMFGRGAEHDVPTIMIQASTPGCDSASMATALAGIDGHHHAERVQRLRQRLGRRCVTRTLAQLVAVDPYIGLLTEPCGSAATGISHELRFEKLPGSFAVEVSGLNCADATPEDVASIEAKLTENKLLIFRDQPLSPEDQLRFTAFFGRPDMAWDNRNRATDEPRIQIITNRYKGGEYHYDRSRRMSTVRYWHADTSFLQNPTRYTFLSIRTVPARHGLTYFANTKLAYEALPPELKAEVNGKFVCHSFNYIFGELLRIRNEQRSEPVPDVVHPLVWDDGCARCLYLSELSQSHVIGVSSQDSDRILTQLTEHCTQAAFRHTHVWREYDFLVWDNVGIMHRGGFSDPQYERILHRSTVTVNDAK